MTKPDRIPCINPRCKRTASLEKYGEGVEIICAKCFRLIPQDIRKRHRGLKRALAKGERRGITQPYTERAAHRVWEQMRWYFNQPDKPEGLENFLREMGMEEASD